MSDTKPKHNTFLPATGVFILLCAVYLVSFSGVFHSGDEIFYLQNAVDFMQGEAASLGKGGPYVFVIGLATRAMEMLGLDARVQILFLLNIPITALTAVFLFLLTVELQYGTRVALLIALLFGLTTPAWVYSKALFREPWAALGLAAALYFVVRFRRRKVPWDLALGLVSLAMAVTTRVSTAVALPFFLAYVASALHNPNPTTGHRSVSWPFKLALLLVLAVLTGLGIWLAIDAYHQAAMRLLYAFTALEPLAGILISPGRGLFIYAPLLVLSVASFGLFYRQHRGEALVIGGSVAAYILILVAWPKWWGGWGWGPRFLVPFMPYLILPLATVLGLIFVQRRWLWLSIPLFAFAVIGAVIQFTGVLVGPSMPAFNLDSPELSFSLSSAPLAWSLAQWERTSLDVALLQMGDDPFRVLLVVLPVGLIIGLGVFLLKRRVTPQPFDRRTILAGGASLLLLVLATVIALHAFSRYDQRYLSPIGFDEAVQYVLDRAQVGDVLVVEHNRSNVAPLITLHDGSRMQDPHIYRSRVFNRCLGDCPPFEEVIRDEWAIRPDAYEWMRHVTGSYQRIWLVMTDLGADQPRAVELTLAEIADSQECQWFAPTVRLCQHDITPAKAPILLDLKVGLKRDSAAGDAFRRQSSVPGVRYPADTRFANGMRLIAYDLAPNVVEPNSSERKVRLSLFWLGDAPPGPAASIVDGESAWWNASEFDVFAHLTDGAVVWQTANRYFADKEPLDRGAFVESVHEFIIPQDMPVGKAHFEVGLYQAFDPDSAAGGSERIAIVDQAEQPLGDMATLGGLFIGEIPSNQSEPSQPIDAIFWDSIQLTDLRVEEDAANGQAQVVLGWRALDRPSQDYTAFVHLIDPTQAIVTQHDQPPGGVDNPTHLWAPNEVVYASFPLQVPPGVRLEDLTLRIGLYDPITGERLPITNLANELAIAPDATYLLIPLRSLR
jgi:hypothetical protein